MFLRFFNLPIDDKAIKAGTADNGTRQESPARPGSLSLNAAPAIDLEHHAGDHAGLIGGEIKRGVRDVLRG